jgi:hypothetical protein
VKARMTVGRNQLTSPFLTMRWERDPGIAVVGRADDGLWVDARR